MIAAYTTLDFAQFSPAGATYGEHVDPLGWLHASVIIGDYHYHVDAYEVEAPDDLTAKIPELQEDVDLVLRLCGENRVQTEKINDRYYVMVILPYAL